MVQGILGGLGGAQGTGDTTGVWVGHGQLEVMVPHGEQLHCAHATSEGLNVPMGNRDLLYLPSFLLETAILSRAVRIRQVSVRTNLSYPGGEGGGGGT